MNNQFIKQAIWIFFFYLLLTAPVLSATAQYTYDNLGRLIQVVYDNGTTITYNYDAAGNRTVQQVTAGQPSTLTQMTTTVSGVTVSQYSYTYNQQDLGDGETCLDPPPAAAEYLANSAFSNEKRSQIYRLCWNFFPVRVTKGA